MARSDLQVFPGQDENSNPFIYGQNFANNSQYNNELNIVEKEDNDTSCIKTVTMSDIDNSEESPYPDNNYQPTTSDFYVPYKPTIEIAQILNQRNSIANQDISYHNENTQAKTQSQNKQTSQRIPERELDISSLANNQKNENKRSSPVFSPLSDQQAPKSFNMRISDLEENKRPSLQNIINPPNSEVYKDGGRNQTSSQVSSSTFSYNEKEAKNESLGQRGGEVNPSIGHSRQSSYKNQEFDKAYFQNISPEVLEILGQYRDKPPQQNPFGELNAQEKPASYSFANNSPGYSGNENYANFHYEKIPGKEEARNNQGKVETFRHINSEIPATEYKGFQKIDPKLNMYQDFGRGDTYHIETMMSDSLDQKVNFLLNETVTGTIGHP